MSGPLLFWTILLVSQWLHPGYDAWVDSISRLIFGKYGWLQTMNFYLLTLFSAAFGILMYISVASVLTGF